MISQAHRFHGRNSLRFVYQRGQSIRSGVVSLRFIANPRYKKYRVAVVVSRKVSKSAVVRNRIRRRIYEVVRVTAAKLDTPIDFVFTIYGDQVADMPFAEIQNMVVDDMEKAIAVTRESTSRHAIVGFKEKNA